MKRVMMVLISCVVLLLAACGGKAGGKDAPAASDSQTEKVLPAANYIQPAETFAGGSGTENDPFQTETVRQLALLAKVTNQDYDWEHQDEKDLYRNGYYVLTADIALNDTSNFANWETEAPAYVWEPIGTRRDDSGYGDFEGVFDGQGHTISGLYSHCELLHDKEDTVGGLFGDADRAQIRNVNITDSMLIAAEKREAGLLVGYSSDSVIENCHVSGRIIVDHVVSSGGVAGGVHGDVFADCSFSGSITAENISGDLGGIAGTASSVFYPVGMITIQGCANNGQVLGWGVDPAMCYKDGDSGSLTITKCRNSGNVSVASGTAGGILSRLMMGGYDFFIEITQCENTGVIHSDGSGRLGGILGGCYAGYVLGEKVACIIRSCVNNGDLRYGNATVNVVDYIPREPGEGRGLNATETAVVAMGGPAAGGIVGSSFGTVVESCLNQGHILLPEGLVPISDIEANVRIAEEVSTVFVGGICGLTLHNSERDTFETEHYTDCAYTDSFAAAVYAPFLSEDSEIIAGNRQITEQEAEAMAMEFLK